MNGPHTKLAATAAALLLTASAAPARAAGGDGEPRVRSFRIECDGGDCARQMAVFIDGDGKAVELGGEDLTWVAGNGHQFAYRTPSEPGPYLGVELTELNRELRAHFGVPEDAGIMVSKVLDDSPASRAGVAVGDIITRIDGTAVSSFPDLWRAVRDTPAGDSVTLEIWRDGRLESLTAAPEERPAASHAVRMMRFQCAEGEDDCGASWTFSPDFDCGDGSCEARIRCEDGECECTVDGAAVDCDELREGRR